MIHRTLLSAVLAAGFAALWAPGSARAASPDADVAAFEAYSGARLVFTARELPAGTYYEIMRELPATRRAGAARIALREVKKYPRGYLGAMGLEAVGIFDGLASARGDGFRAFDKSLGGYRYFGLWNGEDALVAAYYSDSQLPLTLHHEFFHHVDATQAGRTDFAKTFYADDQRFQRAVSGAQRYPALAISAADLAELARRGSGAVLRETVSAYAAKAAGEDQAETARHLMTSLPDALVQMAKRPELAGSQRMLHVLHTYAGAIANGPGVDWFVDVALGRAQLTTRVAVGRAAQRAYTTMQQRIQPASDFKVWGSEDGNGVNWTLRRDLRGFGEAARAVAAQARVTGAMSEVSRAHLGMLGLLARYHQFIAGHWSISAGTQRSFDWTRAQLVAGVGDGAIRRRLERAAWADLARQITAAGEWRGAAAEPRPNPYAAKVDAAIADPAIRRAIRAVQPAAVRLAGGSGVNLARTGLILTAAHVVDRLGAKGSVLFPDGRRLSATTIVFDARLDIALMKIDQQVDDLPIATLAARAPTVGATAITIGQPGRLTPSGEETGYQPFHVSVGKIRGFVGDRLGPQALGETKHDAWTYWGHSGAPIFDTSGRIIAMHNSWDSTTAMRHAVTWEALVKVLRRDR